jgi:hypothetical protein
LVIEQAGIEFRRMMDLQISAGIGEQGEADRVRFREPVRRKSLGGVGDFIDDGLVAAGFSHGFIQCEERAFETGWIFLKTHRATKFLRLRTRVVGQLHGEFDHLLLE